jgi:hypothetical protein
MHKTRVNFLEVLTSTSVNFWTEVLSSSLAINEVSFTIGNEPQEKGENCLFLFFQCREGESGK